MKKLAVILVMLLTANNAYSISDDRVDCNLTGKIAKDEGRFYRLPNKINISFDITADILGSDILGVDKTLQRRDIVTPLSQPASSLINIKHASIVKTKEVLTGHPIDIDDQIAIDYKVKLQKIKKKDINDIVYALGYKKEIKDKANGSLRLYTATTADLVDTKSIKFKQLNVEVEFDFVCTKKFDY